MTKFEPTLEQIIAAQMLFEAMSMEQVIRPKVEGIQKRILDEMKPVERSDCTLITDIKFAWTMSDEQFKIYDDRCQSEYFENLIFPTKFGNCPLLEAESLVRNAQHYLIGIMEPVTKINIDMATQSLEIYYKVVDLTLKLLSPFVKNRYL